MNSIEIFLSLPEKQIFDFILSLATVWNQHFLFEYISTQSNTEDVHPFFRRFSWCLQNYFECNICVLKVQFGNPYSETPSCTVIFMTISPLVVLEDIFWTIPLEQIS